MIEGQQEVVVLVLVLVLGRGKVVVKEGEIQLVVDPTLPDLPSTPPPSKPGTTTDPAQKPVNPR